MHSVRTESDSVLPRRSVQPQTSDRELREHPAYSQLRRLSSSPRAGIQPLKSTALPASYADFGVTAKCTRCGGTRRTISACSSRTSCVFVEPKAPKLRAVATNSSSAAISARNACQPVSNSPLDASDCNLTRAYKRNRKRRDFPIENATRSVFCAYRALTASEELADPAPTR